MSRCRSCDAEVVWIRTDGGKKMPLDAGGPHRDGNILLLPRRHRSVGRELWGQTLREARLADKPLYRSHFATCPDAPDWRRP